MLGSMSSRGPRCLAAICVLAIIAIGARPAQGGGGTRLAADRDHYRVGQRVHLYADIWDPAKSASKGPFIGRLSRPNDTGTASPALLTVPVTIGYLGNEQLRIDVWFTVPKVADGDYWLTICNNPCTTSLGDLVGGAVYVSPVPPTTTTAPWPSFPPTTAAAAVPTTAVVTTAATSASTTATIPATAALTISDEDSTRRFLAPAVGAVLIVLAATGVIVLRRRRHEAMGPAAEMAPVERERELVGTGSET